MSETNTNESFNPWMASEPEGGKGFSLLEAGSYPARCIQVIDLGTHAGEYEGNITERRKVRISFEFPTELHVFKVENGEQPYVVSAEFTFSLHEKGKLRPFLEAWRGRAFTPEELKGFDISKLIGVAGLAQVVHYTNKAGKTREKITNIGMLPKGMTCPDQINEPILYSPSVHDNNTFNKLPKFIQDVILESREGLNIRAQVESIV